MHTAFIFSYYFYGKSELIGESNDILYFGSCNLLIDYYQEVVDKLVIAIARSN